MARGDQLGRQWKIIQTLMASGKGKSAAELAAEIETTPRTVYRDLQALQVAGFPIYTQRTEGKSLWSVLDTVKNRIPIPFTELMALYFSRDMLNVFKDTVFFESLESLFQKIRTTLPNESRTYLGNLQKRLHLSVKPYQDYGRYKEIINGVVHAAVHRKTIEMVYFTMSRKKESRRRVDPYRVWFYNGTFYLIGLCRLRREVRIFAVDRIKMLHRTHETFDVPKGFPWRISWKAVSAYIRGPQPMWRFGFIRMRRVTSGKRSGIRPRKSIFKNGFVWMGPPVEKR